MALSPDKTLILVLRHKGAFLDLIDYIDNQTTADTQIPTPLYARKIAGIAAMLTETDALRVKDGLGLDNLHRNGFLLDYNRAEGLLTLKPWLVEMLRHLDTARLKELTNKDLEHLRVQVGHLAEEMRREGLVANVGVPDFDELLALTFNTLNTVNDKIQQNVASLESQSRHLAGILDSAEIISLDKVVQVREALQRVHVLHERHIKPMLEFIDEKQEYYDKKNPMGLIAVLAELVNGYGYPAIAGRIINIRIRILSHAKKIKEISRLLARYIRQDEEERRRYNSIEQGFNALLQAARNATLSGNQRNKFIRPIHPVFDSGAFLFGLKSHSQTVRQALGWREASGYDVVLSERVRAFQETAKRSAPIDPEKMVGERTQSVDAERARRSAQTRRLLRVLEDFQPPAGAIDAHAALHAFLLCALPNYGLTDLIDALPILRISDNYRFSFTAQMKEIRQAPYLLRYQECLMERGA